jgi:hypothetical protein
MQIDRGWTGAVALALILSSLGCGSDDGTKPSDDANDDGGGAGDNGSEGSAGNGNGGNAGSNGDNNGNAAGNSGDSSNGSNTGASGGNANGEAKCNEAADAMATWTLLDPKLPELGTPDQNADGGKSLGFTGIAYGNGAWVAVARNIGEDVIRWARSEDGLSWTAHSQKTGAGTTFTNSRVHFVQGKFLFFGEHTYNGGAVSYAYVSTDGKTWTANKMSDSRLVLDEFDSSGELTVLAGHDMDMRSSSDLVTWIGGPGVTTGFYSYNDIAFGNGLWLTSINGAGHLYSSQDGMNWTAVSGVTSPGRGFYMEYGNGVWIIFGSVWKLSSDGVTFTDTQATGPVGAPRFTGGRFVTWRTEYSDKSYPDQLTVASSLDGAAWHPMGSMMLEAPADVIALTATGNDAAFGKCKLVIAVTLTVTAGGKSQVKPMFAVGALGK